MPTRTAIFAYDIHERCLRRFSLRTLREWRLDGQLSVHECLLSEQDATRLFDELNRDLDPATDGLLFAWVQGHRAVLARGKGRQRLAHDGLLLAA